MMTERKDITKINIRKVSLSASLLSKKFSISIFHEKHSNKENDTVGGCVDSESEGLRYEFHQCAVVLSDPALLLGSS